MSDPTPTPPPEPAPRLPLEEPKGWTVLGIPVHRRIHTGQRHLPWSSVFILSLVWFTFGFHIFAGGLALTFTIKRYDGDPRVISIVTTLPVIIMLGPFVSYISDKIWTRIGRRRPFLITAWAASCVAMFCFAFMPQVAGTINSLLGSVGIPPVAEFFLLVAIILGYTTLYDLTAPLEPLFLECVPPHQRGRFWAIRGVLFSLAVTFFFQVLWPVYDHHVDLGKYWLGTPEVFNLRGEQWIYVFASFLFFVTGGFLLFSIVETPDPKSPGVRLRDLGLVRFAKSFLKDVFLRKSHYAFYIVLVIPGMEQLVWGNFSNIMQNDQFGYTKENQALWAFPMQMMTMFLLTPFAGWYSDIRVNIRWWLRIVLLLLAGTAIYGAVYFYQTYAPADVRELPDLWVITTITACVAAATGTIFVVLVETMLDITGREHTRAWVSMLAIFLSLGNTIALYVAIQLSAGQIIPITLWMAFNVVAATSGALLSTFVGPMIYEYMPRSQMGTINAGKGLYQGVLQFGVANLGAWWIWGYSLYIFKPEKTQYDYTALYLLQFLLFIPAILAKAWFMWLILSGKVLKWGVMEVEGPETPGAPAPAPASTAPNKG
jgi:MFS family permease